MTWHNTPCAPTLAALSEACPLGWAEIAFSFHRGSATADPPQDDDCTFCIGRCWGIEDSDLPALVDLLDVRLDACWGPASAPVYFLGHNPSYPGSA